MDRDVHRPVDDWDCGGRRSPWGDEGWPDRHGVGTPDGLRRGGAIAPMLREERLLRRPGVRRRADDEADQQPALRDRARGDREGLPKATRSLVNIGMLIALNRAAELEVHIRGVRRNGCSMEEIRAVLRQAAIHCGVSAGSEASRIARKSSRKRPDIDVRHRPPWADRLEGWGESVRRNPVVSADRGTICSRSAMRSDGPSSGASTGA